MGQLQSVVSSQKADGSWQAVHVPSGKVAHGLTKDEAEDDMRELLGVDARGQFDEPLTSDSFSGDGLTIAKFLEGPISEMLAAHSGFARLEAYENGVAHVRLGGGCQGCPAATQTLVQGVLVQLQDEFGEEKVTDIVPVA